jgi:hypothetical protein
LIAATLLDDDGRGCPLGVCGE